MSQARADLDNLRIEESEKILNVLVADASIPDVTRAQAWLTLGLARASNLDDEGARVAFAAALAIDGSLSLPADASPKVKKLFDKVRARLPVTEPRDVPSTAAATAATTPATTPATTTAAAPATTRAAATATAATATAATATARERSADSTAALTTSNGASATTSASQDDKTWAVVTTVTGAALLTAGAIAGAGAWFADDALAHPAAGRTRDDYDSIRSLGVAGLIGAGVLGVSGATALVVGLAGLGP